MFSLFDVRKQIIVLLQNLVAQFTIQVKFLNPDFNFRWIFGCIYFCSVRVSFYYCFLSIYTKLRLI